MSSNYLTRLMRLCVVNKSICQWCIAIGDCIASHDKYFVVTDASDSCIGSLCQIEIAQQPPCTLFFNVQRLNIPNRRATNSAHAAEYIYSVANAAACMALPRHYQVWQTLIAPNAIAGCKTLHHVSLSRGHELILKVASPPSSENNSLLIVETRD